MVNITDLMDEQLLKEMLAQGYVKRRRHPTLPLEIYNYTARAQYEWCWNEVTRQCRGLVATTDGRVVARGLDKFFSIDQLRAAGITPPDEPFEVYEKVDGSLIILFHHDGQWHCASRGSFESLQAQWAAEILRPWLRDWFAPDPEATFYLELVHPENRIVVDYGDTRTLKLLAMFDTETGAEYDLKQSDFPSRARRYPSASLEDLVDALETDPKLAGQEGFVLRYQSGLRVKVKSSEYLALHRLVTRVTPRRIWEHLSSGQAIERMTRGLWLGPQEWMLKHATTLRNRHDLLRERAQLAYQEACDAAAREDGAIDRKAFALHVQRNDNDLAGILYALLDQKDEAEIDQRIWARLKPKGDEVFRSEGEDV